MPVMADDDFDINDWLTLSPVAKSPALTACGTVVLDSREAPHRVGNNGPAQSSNLGDSVAAGVVLEGRRTPSGVMTRPLLILACQALALPS